MSLRKVSSILLASKQRVSVASWSSRNCNAAKKSSTGRRSSSSTSSSTPAEIAEGEAAINIEPTNLVPRHGKGDGVITLNVGGKEFITLRSTIQNNAVLHERVLTAEANQEFTKGAVFIDRDPTYFHLILQHLRNRADMMHNPSSFRSSSSMFSNVMPAKIIHAKTKIFKKKDVLIQLPEKKEALRDLYVEARYFQIAELEALLCSMDWYTMIAQWFGSGSTNPFYTASQAIAGVRNALVASSGFGIVLGAQNEALVKNIKGFFNDVREMLPSLPKSKPQSSFAQQFRAKDKGPDDESAYSFD